MTNLFDLSGKTAIVTGSSRGIGRAIAEEMAAHGANVVISSRKQDACEEVAQAINARGKGRAVALEIMVQTKTVQEYIREDRANELKDVIEKGRDTYGMQSFDQHLSQLYKTGVITLDTASAAATNPADFQRALEFE